MYNDKVLSKMDKKKNTFFNIRNIELKFLGHIIRKEGMENFISSIKIKRDRRKQSIRYLERLSK